jgi:hypothetical protein
MAQTIANKEATKFRTQIEKWGRNRNANGEIIARRLAELEQAHRKLIHTPPESVTAQNKSPWPRPKYVELIYFMMWRVVSSDSGDKYLTSDNPAFFFEAYGIGTANSEITFPISSSIALIACRQGPKGGLECINAKPALVKEVNRRVAAGADRFIYYHENCQWIAALAGKTNPYLSRIQW